MFAHSLGRSARGIAAILLSIFASSAAAVTAPSAPEVKTRQVSMQDARVNLDDSYQRARAARPATVVAAAMAAPARTSAIVKSIAAMRQTMPGLEVKLASVTGAPAAVANNGGALTGPAPGVSSEGIVRGFLRAYGGIYGLSAADVNDLVVLGDSPGGYSGLRMLRMEQQIGGRAIFQSETRFLIDRDGRLVKSVGLMVPDARAVAPTIDPAKLIAPGDAIVRLLASAGRQANAGDFKVTSLDGDRYRIAATNDFVAGEITAREVLFPLAPGMLVPAWSLVVFTSGEHDYYAMVDAETGDVLWRKNIRSHLSAHDARFRVYVQADGKTPTDSPAPKSPTTAVPGGGTQFPEIAPTVVSMHTAMDAIASPNGWINDCPAGVCTANETQTLGNNVLACLDRTGGANANICDTDIGSVLDGNGRPTGNPDANVRNRDFLGTVPRDFQTGFLPPPQGGNPEAGQTATGAGSSGTTAIDSFRRGAVTQLFYLANWYHDQLYRLGFDEASANFQQTNFTGMGVGGDRVLADAQDNSGTDNANFATPPDGTSGRMQMFRFTSPTIDRDGGLDAEIAVHELTHGTSNRLVGNGAGLNWDAAASMGEGWSDFYALSLLNNTNADDPNASYASGGYATYKLGGLLDNYVYGIRRFPYSTNHSVNPMTFADIDDVTNNLSGGIAPDPLGFNFNGAMEVHNAGEIWALTLWGVRARVIANPAGANGDVPTGSKTTLQFVTDGLKMTPIDPTFTEARDAIVQADCATNTCANEGFIWAGFADRGLGYGAKTPYDVSFALFSSHMAVHESFSVPFLDVVNVATDVTINDSSGNNNGAIDPGEPIRLAVKLTNPWRAASKAVASASATLATSTPGVTVWTANATYGAIPPQGSATGSQFLITVAPSVPCGSAINFTLTTTSASLGTTMTSFSLRVGNPSGTDPPITYSMGPALGLAIPDEAPRGVMNQLNITDDNVIADLDFRINNITHTWTGDLTAMLRSPGGIGTDFLSLIGGLAADQGSGDNVVNMVMDDDLAISSANDMVQATAAQAPFTRSWLPVFNAPWPSLAFGIPPDPVGNLSRFDGMSTKGTWTILVSDQVPLDTGSLNAWSFTVTPRHFACTPFVPGVNVTATKSASGVFSPGSTVTYTIILTNSGTAGQLDNPGNEFTDVLPAALTLVNASATSGTAVATIATNTVTWNGTIAPLGGTVTITISATVNASIGTVVNNQATIAYDADANGTNEASNTSNTSSFTVLPPPIARTFVSSTGNDANPCTLTSPCRMLSAALLLTAAAGEIVVLDSAGYGPVVIDRPVTIVAPPGVYAGISVPSGHGIDVNPGPGEVVLRGLNINGLGGDFGVNFMSGDALYIENCVITGFTNTGLNVITPAAASVFVRDSTIRDNFYGAAFGSTSGATGALRAHVERSRIENNATVGIGIIGGSASATIDDSVISGGTWGLYVNPSAAGALARVEARGATIVKNSSSGVRVGGIAGTTAVTNLTDSQLTDNGIGLEMLTGGTAYVSNTTITRNTTGITTVSGNAISLQDNRLLNNGSNGAFSSSVPKQ